MGSGEELTEAKVFGMYVRSLRKVQGLTQNELARRADLSADSIRRLEHGTFAPTLPTLRKLSRGFGIQLSRLFAAMEEGEGDAGGDSLEQVVAGLPGSLRPLAVRVLRALPETDSP